MALVALNGSSRAASVTLEMVSIVMLGAVHQSMRQEGKGTLKGDCVADEPAQSLQTQCREMR